MTMASHRRLSLRLAKALLLLSIHSLVAVWSWIPPHPNSTIEFERVHAMRRRLNQGFNYTTRFVDAEMCRYLTEKECAENDLMMQQHIQAHKSLMKQTRSNPNLGKINVSMFNVWQSAIMLYACMLVFRDGYRQLGLRETYLSHPTLSCSSPFSSAHKYRHWS